MYNMHVFMEWNTTLKFQVSLNSFDIVKRTFFKLIMQSILYKKYFLVYRKSLEYNAGTNFMRRVTFPVIVARVALTVCCVNWN
jgi:hypothetical protein